MVGVRASLGNDRKRRSVRLVEALLLMTLVVATAACGVTRGEDTRDLLMIIPNSPGGGYDQTGRAAVDVMENADITGGSFTVDNVIGAGGAGAMTTLIGKAGDEHTMMTVGLGASGRRTRSPATTGCRTPRRSPS